MKRMSKEGQKQDYRTSAPFIMEPTNRAIGNRSITDVHGRPTSMPHTQCGLEIREKKSGLRGS
jgi:hypothetical protein